MAWNRTKRVVQFYPLISETSATTREKIYKEQRKLQDIIKKLDYQRINVERQFDMDRRSIREELQTRVGTRTIQLEAIDLPKLRRLGLDNAPKHVILTVMRAFPDLLKEVDERLPPVIAGEGTGNSTSEQLPAEQNFIEGLLALAGIEHGVEKPMTPAQCVDRLICDKHITFMKTNNACKEKYKKENMNFDPSLSLRQREYLLRQRSAKRSARARSCRDFSCERIVLNTAGESKENDKNDDLILHDQVDETVVSKDEKDLNSLDKLEEIIVENGNGKKTVSPTREKASITLPDETLLSEDNSPRLDHGQTYDLAQTITKALALRQPASPRNLHTAHGERADILKVVGKMLLQRSKTFPGSTVTDNSNTKQLNLGGAPTNARIEKGVSLRIRQKYLHEPRRQIFIRKVTQEKVTGIRRLPRRSRGQQVSMSANRARAPTLIGWHTIMQNSAHLAQNKGRSSKVNSYVY